MPEWLVVILLGIIEGITEFLPVSSTGHLLIAYHLLPQATQRSDLFTIVIQSGAVLAVLPLFPERLRQFWFQWRSPETQSYMAKILVAFAITGVGGLVMDKLNFQLPEKVLPVALALLVGGILFLIIEHRLKGRQLQSEITWGIAFAVAAAQLVAAGFPGTSRSGSTILIALLLGLNRVAATEFTFLVGIPTMLAAGGWKILQEVTREGAGPGEDWGLLALGFMTSAVVSFAAVKWLLSYVRTHTFSAFGWYRIVFGVVLLLLI